jgi:hypothetical protein
MRLNISTIPSPVHTVYRPPLIPIQYFRNMPKTTDHRIAELRIAPVRVASTTSPEPMYSAHQTKAGPTRARIFSPVGGAGIGLV